MKSLFRTIGFCILLIAVLWKVNTVFAVKHADGIYNMTKFYELEDDSVDILVLGSSHAFENINTGTLWDNYGIAAYVLGGSVQPMWNTYYYLKEALKTQKPELIVLEAYTTVLNSDYTDDSRIIKNTYGMKWSKDKVDAIKVSAPQERWIEFLLPYMQYHTRYTELSREDFFLNKGNIQYDNWKGFGCNMASIAYEAPNVTNVTARSAMTEKTETYYRKTIELALDHEIPVFVTLSPYAGITEEEQAVFNTAEDIAEGYGVGFINYNLLYDEIGIDFSRDVADPGHLNYRGNQKYTTSLGGYIMAHYDVIDRRGDPAYRSWEAEARYIAASIRNQELTETNEISDIAEKIQSSDYQIYVSVDGDCILHQKNLQKVFEILEIPYVENSYFWMVESPDDVRYVSGMEEAMFHMRLDGHDFIMTQSLDDSRQSYINTVMLDRATYKKVERGVNILVYSKVTQSVADAFGIIVDDFDGRVIR